MGAGPNWVFGVCLGFDWTQMTATLRQLAARCGELRGASLSGGPICFDPVCLHSSEFVRLM